MTAKILILISLANVAAIAAYIYGYASLKSTSARIAVLQKDISVETRKVDDLTAVKNALTEFNTYQDAVNSHMVAPDGIIEFVDTLEATAKNTGVEITLDTFKTEEVTPKPLPKLNYLHTSFSVKGNWESVMKFASAMEVMPYQLYVSGLNFQTDKTADDEGVVWRMSVVASVPQIKN